MIYLPRIILDEWYVQRTRAILSDGYEREQLSITEDYVEKRQALIENYERTLHDYLTEVHRATQDSIEFMA